MGKRSLHNSAKTSLSSRKEFGDGKIRTLHRNLLLPFMCISDNDVDSNDRFNYSVDKTGRSVIKQVQNAEASQTGDLENVSNAIEQSADFSKFDSESSNDDVIRCIPKRINKPKNDSQYLDRSNEFSAISSATSQERSSSERIWKAPDRYGTWVSSLEAKGLVC